jgi:hypothetical protein
VAAVLDWGPRSAIVAIDWPVIQARRGEQKCSADTQRSGDGAHQGCIIEHMLDGFKAKDDVEVAPQIWAGCKVPYILHLEGRASRPRYSRPPFRLERLIPLEGETEGPVPQPSSTDGECPVPRSHVQQGPMAARKAAAKPEPAIQHQGVALDQQGTDAEGPEKDRS